MSRPRGSRSATRCRAASPKSTCATTSGSSAGQVLFRLDQRPFHHRRRGSEGAARCGAAADRGDEGDLSAETGRGARRPRPTVGYQQREFERQQRLLASGAASQQQFDQSQPSLQTASAQLASKQEDVANTLASLGGNPDIPVASASDGPARAGSTRPRRAEPVLYGGAGPRNRHRHQGRAASGRRLGQASTPASDPAVFADVDQARLGRGQFQGNRADPYAARTIRDGRDRHLSRCRVSGQGAEPEPRHRSDLCAAAGGKRDRQLGQGGPAPAGAVQLRSARSQTRLHAGLSATVEVDTQYRRPWLDRIDGLLAMARRRGDAELAER